MEPCLERNLALPMHGPTIIAPDGVRLLAFFRDFWRFLRVRKKFWLVPACIIFALFAGLLVVSQGSVIAPFIYVLF
jgi:Family of unknown function (DUF5989)